MIGGFLGITLPFRCQRCLCEQQYRSSASTLNLYTIILINRGHRFYMWKPRCHLPNRASLSFAMVRLLTILSWSLFARSYWSPASKTWQCQAKACQHSTQGHPDVYITSSRDLYSNTPFEFSDPSLVPLHSLLLFSCHRGCLLQAVTHHNTSADNS